MSRLVRPVAVRAARPADLPAIVRRWRDLMQAHQVIDPVLYGVEDHAEGTYGAFVRRHLDKAGSVVLVAEAGGEGLAGYLVGGVGQRAPMFTVRQVGMIFDLVVDPQRRRRGVGKALVATALARFRSHGLGYVQVNFDPQNASAAGFWPSQGFRVLLCEAYRPL